MPIYSCCYVSRLDYKSDFIKRVINSIDTFFKLDSYLVKINLHETAISHRLAIYLDEEFKNYNVDCEWNKNLDGEKRIFTKTLLDNIESIIELYTENPENNLDEDLFRILNKVKQVVNNKNKPNSVKVTDLSGDEMLVFPEPDVEGRVIFKNIRPDIVVHHRGTKDNLGVIEVKKLNSGGKSKYEESKHFDLIKLYALTTQSHLDYQFGIYIEIPEPDFCWKKIDVDVSDFLDKLFGKKAHKVFEITFH